MERLTTRHSGVAVIKDKSRMKEAMEKLAQYEEAMKWTPCSEMNPEISGKYLVYCRNRANEGSYFQIAYINVWSETRKDWLIDGIPIAWMPLPEPYKGE